MSDRQSVSDNVSQGKPSSVIIQPETTTSSCCSPAKQTTCCEPSEKESCCGTSTQTQSGGCGCQ